jgi:hypothetical protein
VKTYRVPNRAISWTSALERASRFARRSSSQSNDCSRDFIAGASSRPDDFSYGLVIGVQSLVRYHRDCDFRRYVQGATLLLAAGKASAWLIGQLYGVRIPIQSGTSVARMVHGVARPADRILWVDDSATNSPDAFPTGMHDLRRHRVATGLDPVQPCIDFIEANAPFRFCLLSVRSPWQELIVSVLMSRRRAKGLTLCVGPGSG